MYELCLAIILIVINALILTHILCVYVLYMYS